MVRVGVVDRGTVLDHRGELLQAQGHLNRLG